MSPMNPAGWAAALAAQVREDQQRRAELDGAPSWCEARPPITPRRCDTCEWSSPVDHPPSNPRHSTHPAKRLCRVNPPVVIAVHGSGAIGMQECWPVVAADDWCGKWRISKSELPEWKGIPDAD